MRRASALALPIVVVVAGVAGAAAAGRPASPSPARVDLTVAPVATDQPAETTSPESTTPSTDSSAATDPSDPPATDAPDPTAAPTTETPTTVVTTTTAPTVDRALVRLVVANGTRQGGLANDTAALLRAVGFVDTIAVDALADRPVSSIYFAPGFEEAGLLLADDLGIRLSRVEPLPFEPLVAPPTTGDVIVVLGTDWVP